MKTLKVYVTKKYYKRSRVGEEPIKYHAKQKRIGADVHATVYMDPVLKKHPDLRKALVRHETDEIRAWGKGSSSAHSGARKREPKVIQNIGGVSGFWREIKRREKQK